MKRGRLLWMLLVLISGCGATLRLSATAPSYDNDGTCSSPVLIPGVNSVWMHFAWQGPASGEDSVLTPRGTRAYLVRNVPSGVYSVRGWASDAAGAGCDTTIAVQLKAPPGRIQP